MVVDVLTFVTTHPEGSGFGSSAGCPVAIVTRDGAM